MLVQHLPRDSALARELHGEAADWSVTDHLLAHIADQLSESNWMFARVNSDTDGESLDYPKPVPRPADEPDAAAEPAAADVSPMARPSMAELTQFFA
ncbi:hypothetical protein ACFRQM_34085 [Streptomyces sp. NPDC056831]|uniref:hypothetical protein n=1 Tax=Streptomyces sp. NPDC056831 TaxID=3345954 RepID=UPI00367846FE